MVLKKLRNNILKYFIGMINRAVVISTNPNVDYLFYLPIVTWAWNIFGWNVICVIPATYSHSSIMSFVFNTANKYCNVGFIPFENIDGYRSETIAQCSRLYVSGVDMDLFGNDYYLMTSDVDMLPLSDYWNPDYDKITSWGRDLSDKHYPICYIGARQSEWIQFMNLTHGYQADLKRDLDLMPEAKSDNWQEWWQVDQQHVTKVLNEQKEIIRIDRGIDKNTGYPIGRIDRSAWEKSLLQKERIDCHLLRPGYTTENFEKIIALIKENFNPPQEEMDWITEYRNEYIKML